MPLLPYLDAGSPPASPGPVRTAEGQGGIAFADALRDVAVVTQRIGDARQRAKLSTALVDSTIELGEAQDAIRASGDFEGAEATFTKALDAQRERAKELRGEYAAEFENRLRTLGAQESLNIRSWAREESARATRVDAESDLQKLSARFADAGTPSILEQAEEILLRATEDGAYGIDEVSQVREDWLSRTAADRAAVLLHKDPLLAKEAIESGEGIFNQIPERVRIGFLEQAEGRIESSLRERELREKDLRDRVSDEVRKGLVRLAAPGGPGITREDVEAVSEYLDASQFEHAMKLVSSGGRLRDGRGGSPEVFISLSTAASAGENVQSGADSALLAGEITRPEYDQILGVSRKRVFGDAVRYVVESTKVSEANNDPAARLRSAEAVAQMNDWILRNPESSREEASKKAREIVRDAVFVDLSQDLGLLKPTVLSQRPSSLEEVEMARNETLRQFMRSYGLEASLETARDDLDVAIQENPAAVRRLLSDPEFRQQILLIRNWRRMIERAEAAK